MKLNFNLIDGNSIKTVLKDEYNDLMKYYITKHPKPSPSCCCAICVRLRLLENLHRKARTEYLGKIQLLNK